MVFTTTKQVGVLRAHVGAVHCVAYSSGAGNYVLSGGADRKIHLWNPSNQSRIQTYAAHGYEVLSLACSHDNTTFASGGGDKLLFLWDVATATTLRRFEGHWARINCVDFNDDSSVVASGSFDATVRFWDTRSSNRKPIQTLEDAKDSVSDLHVVATEVVAGSVDGRVRNYDLRMGRCATDVISSAPVTSVRQSGDGAAVLVGSLDATLRLMDKRDGKMLQSYKGHKNGELRIKSTLAENEEFVVSGSEDGYVWVWDLLEGKVREKIRAHEGKVVTAADWCPGQGKKQMVTAGGDGTVMVWGGQ